MKLKPNVFCLLCLVWTAPALAVLGGSPMTMAADRAQSKNAAVVTANAAYSVHELQLPSGTTVREYVTPDNLVFALSWQGPFMPNLQDLLGGYFDHYARAASRPHVGRQPVEVKNSEVVMHAGGHLRAFQGHAYLPGKFPPGVTPDDIQ